MKIFATFLALLFCSALLRADNCASLPSPTVLSDDGLARTPRMGWNSWYAFHASPTEAELKNQADLMVSSGLSAVGYNWIAVDDGWAGGRDGSGNIIPNATRFPDGMAATISYVHADGLSFQIYSSPAGTTCGGATGSGTHESADATTFATWGADALLYDGCSVSGLYTSCWNASGPQVWQMMAQDIRATGRSMLMFLGTSVAPWSNETAIRWDKDVGYDETYFPKTNTNGSWSNFDADIDQMAGMYRYQKVGSWLNCDYLIGSTEDAAFGTFTQQQSQTQFGLFALWSCPMFLGMDISTISAPLLAIYKNSDVITVDQDAAGAAAHRVLKQPCGSKTCEAWLKPLADGSYALGLLNRDSASHTIAYSFSSLGGSPDVVDLWTGTDLGSMSSYSTSVAGYGLALLKVVPTASGGTAISKTKAVNIGMH